MKNPMHLGNRLKSIPPAPESLSAGAKQEWSDLAGLIFEIQTARPADLPSLGLLCEIQADIRNLEATVRNDGYTIEAGSGGRKAHPALQALTAARRQAQTLLDLFGLLPSGKRVWDNY